MFSPSGTIAENETDGIPLIFIGAGRQFHRDKVLGRGHGNPFELIVLRFGGANGVEVEGLQVTPFLTRAIDEIRPHSLFRDSSSSERDGDPHEDGPEKNHGASCPHGVASGEATEGVARHEQQNDGNNVGDA